MKDLKNFKIKDGKAEVSFNLTKEEASQRCEMIAERLAGVDTQILDAEKAVLHAQQEVVNLNAAKAAMIERKADFQAIVDSL